MIPSPQWLFSKQVENQSEQNAQKNACGQWEVKREVASLNPDVPRKMPEVQERQEMRMIYQQTDHDQDDSDNDQQLAHSHIRSIPASFSRIQRKDLKLTESYTLITGRGDSRMIE